MSAPWLRVKGKAVDHLVETWKGTGDGILRVDAMCSRMRPRLIQYGELMGMSAPFERPICSDCKHRLRIHAEQVASLIETYDREAP